MDILTRRVLLCDGETALRVLVALRSLTWGFWVASPLFYFEDRALFVLMAQMAREEVWGGTLLMLGIVQLAAATRRSEWLVRRSFSTGAIVWAGLVALALAGSGVSSTAIPMWTLTALASAWIFVRAGAYGQ